MSDPRDAPGIALGASAGGDFLEVLRRHGHPFAGRGGAPGPGGGARPPPPGGGAHAPVVGAHAPVVDVHGTTVIAIKFQGGVLNVGDRRATAANAVMYDRADKILPLDDSTLLAMSGSYATAMDVVRYLRHAFHYYRRTQLQEMSLEGKLSEVSRVIARNLPNALSGLGAFIPVLSAYDCEAGEGRVFFYDGMGARFESAEWGAAGSGSERIRGAFDYILKTKGSFREMSLDTALRETLVLLDIAAEMDSATGGYEKILPSAKTVTCDGIEVLPEERLRAVLAGTGRAR